MAPGFVTWFLILGPILLSLRVPEVVAWFVISFDFYWMYRSIVLSVSVIISFRRVRRVTRVDWRSRVFQLSDPNGRHEELGALIEPAARAFSLAVRLRQRSRDSGR